MPAMRRNDRSGPGITIASFAASLDASGAGLLIEEGGCAPRAAGLAAKIADAGIGWQIAKENKPAKQRTRGDADRIETTPFNQSWKACPESLLMGP